MVSIQITTDLPDLVMPQVSINGTSVDALVADQAAVITGLSQVIRRMMAARPHGRDYQYRPAELKQAQTAWEARITLLEDLQREICDHAHAIQNTEG
jgi:hypothetical protein